LAESLARFFDTDRGQLRRNAWAPRSHRSRALRAHPTPS